MNNYNKLVSLNLISRITMSACIVLLIFILGFRESYQLNLTIIYVVICITIIFITILLFKLCIYKIVLQECDYSSYLLYLKKKLKGKIESAGAVCQIDFVTTYLMMGMYAEAGNVLKILNKAISNVNAKQYMYIYLLNLRYIAESGAEEADKLLNQTEWDIESRIDKRRRKCILDQVEVWRAIIDKNWKNVIELLQELEVESESSRVILTYWYAVANKNIGNADVAKSHFEYVRRFGGNTGYVKFAEKENTSENIQIETSVVKKKYLFGNIIASILCLLVLICSFGLWGWIVHFNTNTNTILKRYNFTVNQQEVKNIYSEVFDNYDYEIFRYRDNFYYCILKKDNQYYCLLKCYESDMSEMQDYRKFDRYLDDEELNKVQIADMEFYVTNYIESVKNLSKKEKYLFPCIGVYNDERIKNVKVDGELPLIKELKMQGESWYIWKYERKNFKMMKRL